MQDQPGTATIYGDRVHKTLEAYLKGTAALDAETVRLAALCDVVLKGADNVMVEQELTINQSMEPTGWWDADAWLRSKLDVLVVKGPGAVVLDWKTGKRRPDFAQLQLFALQVMLHYPEVDKVKSMFIWTQDSVSDSETYRREHLGTMKAALLARTGRIEDAVASTIWPAKPSGLCRFCPCRNFCEFAA